MAIGSRPRRAPWSHWQRVTDVPPRPTRRTRVRKVVDLEGSQLGDFTTGDNAGNNIYHNQGVPWEAVMQRLDAEVTFRDGIVAALRQERTELRQRLDRWEKDQALYQGIERDARQTRQQQLDNDLRAIRSDVAKLQDDNISLRFYIGALALLIVVVFSVLALLLYDRYMAVTFLRYWLGAGLGAAAALVRLLP